MTTQIQKNNLKRASLIKKAQTKLTDIEPKYKKLKKQYEKLKRQIYFAERTVFVGDYVAWSEYSGNHGRDVDHYEGFVISEPKKENYRTVVKVKAVKQRRDYYNSDGEFEPYETEVNVTDLNLKDIPHDILYVPTDHHQ